MESHWVGEVEVVSDPAEAVWLTDALMPLFNAERVVRVGAVVPVGFDSYVRIEHGSPDDEHEAREGSLPDELGQTLVSVLTKGVGAPQRCWMAVWEGWGDMPRSTPVVRVPGRAYVLLSGPLAAVSQPLWTYDGETGLYTSPALWWPDNRAWCVATEVDFTWTYVGGPAALAAELLNHPDLQARTVTPDTNT